jgi:hypothetical protein
MAQVIKLLKVKVIGQVRLEYLSKILQSDWMNVNISKIVDGNGGFISNLSCFLGLGLVD